MNDIQLSEIFKTEYSNLIAVLCHYYGIKDLQEAEDIVSETFLKAMKTWAHKGIPEHPKAWLRKTALNIIRDQHRRQKTYDNAVIPNLNIYDDDISTQEIDAEIIEDSQLRMIFVICHPKLKMESQISAALRILCGFNIDEIATALLSNKETINKRLYRAKKTIKELKSFDLELEDHEYKSRLDNVLRIIYLIFNEGYYSSVDERNIKHEICWEAMRLCLFLTKQKILPKANIYALLALMCFHTSRLAARETNSQAYVLYHQQDRSKWNYDLITKGEKFLHLASKGSIISKYHLEAAIAYWHTTENNEKWEQILHLYNKLLTIEYSPIIAMNRTYALAHTHGAKQAILEASKLNLSDNHYYHCLLAELHRMNNDQKESIISLKTALSLAKKENEKRLITEKINQIKAS